MIQKQTISSIKSRNKLARLFSSEARNRYAKVQYFSGAALVLRLITLNVATILSAFIWFAKNTKAFLYFLDSESPEFRDLH
jgi:hypothetical protein